MVTPERGGEFSRVDLGKWTRVAMMLEPKGGGDFARQAGELFGRMRERLLAQEPPLTLTTQTVFLRNSEDQADCQRLIESHFGTQTPLTSFVHEPPVNDAALAVEAWAMGGPDIHLERCGPHALKLSYDDMHWAFSGGIDVGPDPKGVYAQTKQALEEMNKALCSAGASLEHAVRTWFYLGTITGAEGTSQRYKELNRARSDVYRHLNFHQRMPQRVAAGIYPASTGIGMQGRRLTAGCLALQTKRPDLRLVALENPRQTPAYAYHPRYSPKSPKFSRAMALALKEYVTVWVSGTASIVDSESLHAGNATRQTEQTIDNIERLISAENLALHGIDRAGAELQDLAKIRVYVKRPEDVPAVRTVCSRRFGAVPALYAIADICRPELLVEIEGVAFSRRT